MNAILTRLLYEMDERRDTVLCTIIADRGSTPRGAGSQMLVGESGLLSGTIGGGAVEGGAVALSKTLLHEQRSAVHEYLLRHNEEEDIGMVCGGDVTVLAQFIAAEDAQWKTLAHEALQRIAAREGGTLCLHRDGSAALLGADGALLCGEPPRADSFTMPLPIGERAVIFGAGHCSAALAPLLETVGFRVTVMDERAELVTRERFLTAEQLICGDFAKLSDYFTFGAEDYLVVMTNGHIHDFEVQRQILCGPYAYVGVIGSARKTASVNEKLRAAGIPDAAIESVHTPIGTKIMAVTPQEIAVSIAGEMILARALRRERAGVVLHGCPMH